MSVRRQAPVLMEPIRGPATGKGQTTNTAIRLFFVCHVFATVEYYDLGEDTYAKGATE